MAADGQEHRADGREHPGGRGRPPEWHVFSSRRGYERELAFADACGRDFRDHPLPDFLAGGDQARLISCALRHGWDVTCYPAITDNATIGVRIEAFPPDKSQLVEQWFGSGTWADGTGLEEDLQQISGHPAGDGGNLPPAAAPGAPASLAARALLTAEYAARTYTSPWHDRYTAATGHLRSAAGHLDDGRPGWALSEATAARLAVQAAARAIETAGDDYGELPGARAVAALTLQMETQLQAACAALAPPRPAAPARPRRPETRQRPAQDGPAPSA